MNKQVYFTSDWHIGHEKALEFDKRPFRNIDHMHEVLINNYNNTVGKHDICYFLGDLGLYRKDQTKEVIQALHGNKILVMGNHDKAGRQFWFSCGFHTVLNAGMIHLAGEMITFSHCPLRGVFREDTSKMKGGVEGESWHKERKHAESFSIPNWGQFHLHGHIHSGPHRKDKKTYLGRQMDIGCVAHNYTPVGVRKINSFVDLTKKKENGE